MKEILLYVIQSAVTAGVVAGLPHMIAVLLKNSVSRRGGRRDEVWHDRSVYLSYSSWGWHTSVGVSCSVRAWRS